MSLLFIDIVSSRGPHCCTALIRIGSAVTGLNEGDKYILQRGDNLFDTHNLVASPIEMAKSVPPLKQTYIAVFS